MNWFIPIGAVLAIAIHGESVADQNYPNKPVRIVVSAASGGGTDFVARVLENHLSENLKQPMVIDNRGGAGGMVGADIVARSSPDGYTLLMTFINLSIYPSLHSKLSFNPIKDFAPISMLATSPLILIVNPKVPAKNVKELIALAKTDDTLSYASPGVGSLGHLAGELFKMMTGIRMTHIAYRGGGPSLTATMVGDVQLFFSTMPSALIQINAGRLRGLAVTSAKRSASAPDIPTLAESGIPGYDVTGWFGVLAPAKTPKQIGLRLNDAFAKSLAASGVAALLQKGGVEPAGSMPEEFAATIKSDVAKWIKVVKEAGIPPQ